METGLFALRLLLALVFLVAGFAKLADPAGSRKSMADFGVPGLLSTPLGIILPLLELAIGISLLSQSAAWPGAVGGLALLLLFIAGISVTLARGLRPDCHCFGQIHSTPIGWKTLTRNAVLAAAAAFLVRQGQENAGPSRWGWIGSLNPAEKWIFFMGAMGFGILAILTSLIVGLMRQNGRLMLRLDEIEARLAGGDTAQPSPAPPPGLPVGSAAPAFNLTSLDGRESTLADLLAPAKPLLLMFIGPSCNPCDALLPEIAGWQREHAGKLTVALISSGGVPENRAKKKKYGLKRVLIQKDREVAEAYQANATPAAVLVNPDGTIGSYVSLGADEIKGFVIQQTMPPPAKVGEFAPAINLPGLNGRPVSLEQFRGHEAVVLFWNPGCGFCQEILEDIKAWERERPENAPRLLVVSSGTVKDNKEQGFRAPVVLDTDFVIGHVLGSAGTPSAVLVDREGRIASEVAVGADAVFGLAGIKRPAKAVA